MTFFSWLPQDSPQTASPWLALYVGLTVLLTTVTMLWFNRRSSKAMALANLQQELDVDADRSLFLKPNFSSSPNRDIELGVMVQ